MSRRLQTTAIILIFIEACAFKPTKAPTTPDQTLHQLSGSPSASADLITGARPNDYQVRVSWVPDSELVAIVVRRTNQDGTQVDSPLQDASKGSYLDPNPEPGSTVNYTLLVAQPKLRELAQWSVRIPKDLEFNQTQQLSVEAIQSGFIKADRIFFAPGAHLITQGADLEIQASEIISNDGLIESFTDTATAAPLQRGRSGGRIRIHSRTGFGKLRIIMRGEGGGMGAPGIIGSPGQPGAAGNDAQSRLTYDPDIGMRGSKTKICTAEAGDGNKGQDGGRGQPGAAGLAGGDSGSVSISVDDADARLEVSPVLIGGRGGQGGLGGAGGVPGSGGAAGRGNDVCTHQAAAGANGNFGPAGERGAPGIVGRIESSCLKLGLVQLGSCRESSL